MSNPALLRVLIADDEAIARRGLERLCRAQPGVELVASARTGEEALAEIKTKRPQVALLDVAMPGLSGVDVVRALPADERPLVVFVTAFDRFAVEAFDLHAVDYLLKPFDADRFAVAMRRVMERLAASATESAKLDSLIAHFDQQRPWAGRLSIKDGDRVITVPLQDIEWCEAQDNYVRIHAAGRRHLVRLTMRALEQQLDGRFSRIHRSAIVNLSRVTEMKPSINGEYQVALDTGTRLTLSRGYRDAVLDRVSGQLVRASAIRVPVDP